MNWIEAGLIMWALVNTLGLCVAIIFTRTMGIVVTQETDRKLNKLVKQTFGVELEGDDYVR